MMSSGLSVVSRGNPRVNTAMKGSAGSPPTALSTATRTVSSGSPSPAWARRAKAISGTRQPRQAMWPSSQSGASATGSGVGSVMTSATVALGSSRRRSPAGTSTQRISRGRVGSLITGSWGR
jgi:hypothetical protein